MRDGLTIQGRGLVMYGHLDPEEFGLLIKEEGLQGWESLPAGRRQALERSLSDGEHDVPVRLPARTITIDGNIIAKSVTDLNRQGHRIRGWGATGVRFPLTVTLQGETLTANVRSILREAEDSGSRGGGFHSAPFQVQLVAADPRKYAAPKTFEAPSGSAAVENWGNFPAHPVIEIPGAPAAYTVTSPAGVFTVTGATAGGTHQIDMRTGRVTRNGTWMQGVGRGRLWAVPEGTTWDHILSVPGRVIIRDTFV